MPKLESDLLQSLERVVRGRGGGGRCGNWRSPLEGEPGVAQALGGRGSLLGDQLQHGQQEVGEAIGLLPRPLVLVHQHLQQAPGLQLGDVFQVTCSGATQRRVREQHAAGVQRRRRWEHTAEIPIYCDTPLKQLVRLVKFGCVTNSLACLGSWQRRLPHIDTEQCD